MPSPTTPYSIFIAPQPNSTQGARAACLNPMVDGRDPGTQCPPDEGWLGGCQPGGECYNATMWDERYSEEGFAYGTEANEFLVQVADQIPAGPVLCLAEGEGRNAVYIGSRGHEVLAVDQSAVGLAKAQTLAAERGISLETLTCDLSEVPFEANHYAAIVSIWAHVPPPLRQFVHGQCVKSLAPGGVLVLEAYTPAQVGRGTGGPPDPTLCMRAEDLRSELAGLDFETLVERERFVSEGKYHHGKSAVVQLLARKPPHGPASR